MAVGLVPWSVYGPNPRVTPGGGFTSQRTPKERLKRGDTFHSSSPNAEKFVYKGYAGAMLIASVKALFVSTPPSLKYK